MCVKIIGVSEQEFNPSQPLENQISDAKEIIVNYDPTDSKIDSFVGQVESMVKNGISCHADIKVNANNTLNGIRLERKLEKLKRELDINEVIKGLSNLYPAADKKLSEISEMCMGKMNE